MRTEAAGGDRARDALLEYKRSGGRASRDEVVISYQGLAYSLALRFSRMGEDLEDLNQVALIGLLKAIERYRPEVGAELTTFATATILGELKRYFRDRSWSVRPPRRVHDLQLSVQAASEELTQEFGRAAGVEEIAARLDTEEDLVREAMTAAAGRRSVSLSALGGALPSGESNQAVDGRLVADEGAELEFEQVDDALMLQPLIERLPRLQQDILHLRFREGCSQTEIGERLEITQMQVSRLLRRSITRLREWSTAEEYRAWLEEILGPQT